MMPARLTNRSHPVQRLQVELVGGLGRDELHGRALRPSGDRFRVAIVVLLTLEYGRTRRYQPGVAAKRL
jgi:hypothetical protein